MINLIKKWKEIYSSEQISHINIPRKEIFILFGIILSIQTAIFFVFSGIFIIIAVILFVLVACLFAIFMKIWRKYYSAIWIILVQLIWIVRTNIFKFMQRRSIAQSWCL